jgi:hypothetical protein
MRIWIFALMLGLAACDGGDDDDDDDGQQVTLELGQCNVAVGFCAISTNDKPAVCLPYGATDPQRGVCVRLCDQACMTNTGTCAMATDGRMGCKITCDAPAVCAPTETAPFAATCQMGLCAGYVDH